MDVCRLIELDIDICRLMGIDCEKPLATAPELEEPLASGTMKCLARGSSQTEQRISATESGPPCSMPAAMHVSHTHVPPIFNLLNTIRFPSDVCALDARSGFLRFFNLYDKS
jgi:hypothetical protein